VTKDQYIDLLKKEAYAKGNGQYLPSDQPVLDNFGSYLNSLGTSGINASNVASKEDYDKLAALEALLPDQVNEKFISSPDKAGTYNGDITDFNYKALIDYLTNQNNAILNRPHEGYARPGG
jgi:hypothetical protein